MFSLAVILVCGLLVQAPPNDPRCVGDAPQILIHVGASEAKRSEAVVGVLLGSISNYVIPLLLMFGLPVILVCGLLLQALPNLPRCLTDALRTLFHVGGNEAKRSEAMVWGLLGSCS